MRVKINPDSGCFFLLFVSIQENSAVHNRLTSGKSPIFIHLPSTDDHTCSAEKRSLLSETFSDIQEEYRKTTSPV